MFSETERVVSPLQLWNALHPIEVTLSGNVMLVKLLQPKNAEFPIEVTLSGILMFVKPWQVLNANAARTKSSESPGLPPVIPRSKITIEIYLRSTERYLSSFYKENFKARFASLAAFAFFFGVAFCFILLGVQFLDNP